MKRILGVLAIVATSAVLSATSIMGADVMGDEMIPGNSEEKNMCLLVAQTCETNVDSIHQRIERLNREIAKGTDVYTADELQILRNKLDDAVRLLDGLISG